MSLTVQCLRKNSTYDATMVLFVSPIRYMVLNILVIKMKEKYQKMYTPRKKTLDALQK